MSVTVDDEVLATESLGLLTVGQVLLHLQKDNRLVVNLLIDGREPDLGRMGAVRSAPLCQHTIYIETTEPRAMALDVITEVEGHLREADRLKSEAVDLLQRNATQKAMEKLSGCFSTWQHAQESVRKTATLLRIDLDAIHVEDMTLQQFLSEFAGQLRDIKTALENRDFVMLSDILVYEVSHASRRWALALQSIRGVVK